MTRSSMKRPGKELEGRIESVFKKLNALPGVFALRLNPEYKRGAKCYCAAQPCDYMVRTATMTTFFDAKECGEDAFYLSKARPNQVESLLKLNRLGCRVGFLIWFYNADFQGLRWLSPASGSFPKSAKWNSLTVFDWENLIHERMSCVKLIWQ